MEQINSRITRATTVNSTSLPECGKIKIGIKSVSSGGKEYPTAIDSFVATGQYASKFFEQYPAIFYVDGQEFKTHPEAMKVAMEKKKGITVKGANKITIVFATNDINEVCRESYQCWKDGKFWGDGDGVNYRVYDIAKKDFVNCKADDQRVKDLQWDEYLELRFIIPKIKGLVGQWKLMTKGKKSSIPSLVKAFDFVNKHAKNVQMIPFDLTVEKKKGYTPGEVRNYPVIKLFPHVNEENIALIKQFMPDSNIDELQAILGGMTELKQLESGDTIVDTTFEEVIETPADIAKNMLRAAKTTIELQVIWQGLTAEQRKLEGVASEKELLKSNLTVTQQ